MWLQFSVTLCLCDEKGLVAHPLTCADARPTAHLEEQFERFISNTMILNKRQNGLEDIRVQPHRRLVSMAGLAALAMLFAAPLAAQQPTTPVPQIVTVGRGEVEVKPDRARLQFGVETRASTAAAASAENSRRQNAVLDTLQRMGIAAKKIQTSNLQVTPEMVYPGQGQPPRVAGYVARNTVRVEVEKLEQTGAFVDAALSKGATTIAGLQFYSSRSAEARRDALARAVSAARLDAEAMAVAAGVQLGALLEISSNQASDGPIMYNMEMAMGARAAAAPPPTPVNPGELKVVETVTVRWAVKQ